MRQRSYGKDQWKAVPGIRRRSAKDLRWEQVCPNQKAQNKPGVAWGLECSELGEQCRCWERARQARAQN